MDAGKERTFPFLDSPILVMIGPESTARSTAVSPRKRVKEGWQKGATTRPSGAVAGGPGRGGGGEACRCLACGPYLVKTGAAVDRFVQAGQEGYLRGCAALGADGRV